MEKRSWESDPCYFDLVGSIPDPSNMVNTSDNETAPYQVWSENSLDIKDKPSFWSNQTLILPDSNPNMRATTACCPWSEQSSSSSSVPAGSPSRGGDVAVYVFDVNQPSLPTPFHSVLVSFSVFMALSTVFHCINSPDNSPFSFCSSDLISALLALSTIYLFMKVSLSPDIIPCGWLGSKYQLAN